MSAVPLPEFEYTVHTMTPAKASSDMYRIRAAYFQEDGSYVLFKDASHAVVGAFKTEFMLRAARMDEPVER